MSNHKRAKRRIMCAAGLLIAIAYSCRVISHTTDLWNLQLSVLRSILYIVVFSAWGVSLKQRIIQKQTQRQLVFIAVLMVFWVSVRTIKYHFVEESHLERWLWYRYYLPLIVIPLLTFFVSHSICRSEEYRLPRNLILLYLPATALLLAVLSNDLHQQVFVFKDASFSEMDYSYGPVYLVIVFWIMFFFTAAIVTVYRRNRMRDRSWRLRSPLLILLLMGVYSLAYGLRIPVINFWLGDYTIVLCLCLMEFFESLFRNNLIQTNTRYLDLFTNTSILAVLVDENFKPQATTKGYTPIDPMLMKNCVEEPVLLDNGMRLSCSAITDGHVLWEEDIRALVKITEQLEETRVSIEEQNAAELEAYKAERVKHQLQEKNRLYDKLQKQTRTKVDELSRLLDELEETEDPLEEKLLLLRISVIGAYIKRRSNLSFLSEDWQSFPSRVLKNCLEQSLDCLTLFHIEAEQNFALKEDLTIQATVRIYEVFEEITEACLDELEEMFLTLSKQADTILLRMRICTSFDLSDLKMDGLRVMKEAEGEWLLVYETSLEGETE